jgi:hypothetical protein
MVLHINGFISYCATRKLYERTGKWWVLYDKPQISVDEKDKIIHWCGICTNVFSKPATGRIIHPDRVQNPVRVYSQTSCYLSEF